MKPEFKLMMRGFLLLLVSLFFIVWGLMDILSVTGGSTELLIIVPVIVTIIYFVVIGVLVVVSVVLKRRNILYKKVHNCTACGAVIKLEEKFCVKCGAENVIRYEALEKLEDLERQIEEVKANRAEKLKPWKRGRTRGGKRLQEINDEILYNKSIEVRLKKTKLITGNSHEGRLEWIKTQYYDLNRSIQDVADDLGESMITVRKYLDEIENQDITKNEKKSHQEDSID